MVKRDYVPISFVQNRATNLLAKDTVDGLSLMREFNNVMSSIENEHIDESSIVKYFIKDCMSVPHANDYFGECVAILEATEDAPYHSHIVKEINDNIIPKYKDLTKLETFIEDMEDGEAKTLFSETLQSLKESDRLIHNCEMIGSRFNLDLYKKKFQIAGISGSPVQEVAESYSSLIDTYDMPLRKKFAVALETAIYMNTMYGNPSNNAAVLEGITDYFLLNNPIITDRDYNSIKNTLESNSFIDNNDIKLVNYLLENSPVSFQDRILEFTKDKSITSEYKELITKIANCKGAVVAKGLIKAAFTLIISTFIISGTAAFTAVASLLCAIYGLILTAALSPAVIIGTIKAEFKESEKAISVYKDGKNTEIVKRYNKVYNFCKNISSSIESGDALQEAANAIESIIPDEGIDAPVLKKQLDDETEWGNIYSINDTQLESFFNESEKFADSADVKDLLKRYKAEQKKTIPGFKRVINKVFTNKPENVIDGIPHMLSFVRVAFILSTVAVPVVGPAIALVGFFVDRLIEMCAKRDEAERCLKFFKAERETVEKKYNNLKDGDKKDDLTQYLNCLDKCIDKLEESRDKLYTDAELDRMNSLDEAAMDVLNKMEPSEFFKVYGGALVKAVEMSVQFIRNEIVRRTGNGTNSICSYYEYESNSEPISRIIKKFGDTEIVNFYTTPDGMIDIPLGKIVHNAVGTDDVYRIASEIASEANRYIDKDFCVTCYKRDNKIGFTLNCFKCINTTRYVEDFEKASFSEAASDIIGEILVNAEFFDEAASYEPTTILNEFSSCFEEIAPYEWDEIELYISRSGLDTVGFKGSLLDYKESLPKTDPNVAEIDAVVTFLNSIDYKNDADHYEGYSQLQYITALESVELLRAITEEAKERKAAKKNPPKDKGPLASASNKVKGVVAIAKDKVNKKMEDNKNKEKVPITTTVKLGAKAAQNKAKDLSSKEKEVSKTIDAYSSTIVKKSKEALTSNRREAIIKGSVIPSFSKMIKGAVGLGFIAKLFSPVTAAIAAIGALGVSKHLTRKERQLLLEEIDVELEVIEKQIEHCDQSDAKKYKDLLMYQRKLQRESQRIKYNLKVRGKDVPDPTA